MKGPAQPLLVLECSSMIRKLIIRLLDRLDSVFHSGILRGTSCSLITVDATPQVMGLVWDSRLLVQLQHLP